MTWPRPTLPEDTPDETIWQLARLAEQRDNEENIPPPVQRLRWQGEAIQNAVRCLPRGPIVPTRIRFTERSPEICVVETIDGRMALCRTTLQGTVFPAPQNPALLHSVRVVLAERFPNDEHWPVETIVVDKLNEPIGTLKPRQLTSDAAPVVASNE